MGVGFGEIHSICKELGMYNKVPCLDIGEIECFEDDWDSREIIGSFQDACKTAGLFYRTGDNFVITIPLGNKEVQYVCEYSSDYHGASVLVKVKDLAVYPSKGYSIEAESIAEDTLINLLELFNNYMQAVLSGYDIPTRTRVFGWCSTRYELLTS